MTVIVKRKISSSGSKTAEKKISGNENVFTMDCTE